MFKLYLYYIKGVLMEKPLILLFLFISLFLFTWGFNISDDIYFIEIDHYFKEGTKHYYVLWNGKALVYDLEQTIFKSNGKSFIKSTYTSDGSIALYIFSSISLIISIIIFGIHWGDGYYDDILRQIVQNDMEMCDDGVNYHSYGRLFDSKQLSFYFSFKDFKKHKIYKSKVDLRNDKLRKIGIK